MAKKLKVVKKTIESLDEPWCDPDAGTCHDIEDIENFIKAQFEKAASDLNDGLSKKPSVFKRSQEKGADNCYHIYGFASEEDYLNWNSDPDTYAELLLSDVSLPDTGGGSSAVSYIVSLLRETSGDIVTIDNTVKLNVKFTSQEFNPIDQSTNDTQEGGVMTVQTRLNESAQWTTKGTINIPYISSDSDKWFEADLTPMMASGRQQVRIIVKGETTELSTRYLSFWVTRTTLGLQLSTLWEQPVTDGILRLGYYINGAVAKTLHVLIDGKRKVEFPLGLTTYTQTPYQCSISDADDEPNKIITHGVHTVQAWLSVNNSDVVSETLTSQHMIVTDPADTTPRLLLNDLKQSITNWTTEQLFTYSLYNPSGQALPLKLALMNYAGTENYMTLDLGEVTPNERRALINVIEIESDEVSIDAYMRFLSGETEIHEMIGFSVDNTENFAPTAGYGMAINPRSRTNDEVNPMSIINSVTGEIVPSVWKNFGLVTDGWITDEDNNKCLRLPSGTSIDIDYETFKDYIGTDNRRSLTIELDFASRNVTDENEPALRMCSYMPDEKPLGFELLPISGRFLTQSNRSVDDQDVGFLRDKRTHLMVNIVYGINGSSVNMVRIFVNGTCSREFTWETSDVFVQFVDGVRTSQGIRLGSVGTDIDIYNLRIYHTALSSSDVLQNYMASQASVSQKLAIRQANDLLGDDGRISYAKAHEKYQTICWCIDEGAHLPAYGDTKKYEILSPVTIIGRKTADGFKDEFLYNWFLLGQGTSSMTYFGWNIAMNPKTKNHKDDAVLSKVKGTWVDIHGVEHKSVYALNDGDPEAAKLVAKANWASSQQTHKMGSVNAFNDLWKAVTGGSTMTNTPGYENCRVSVKQEEFLGFVKIGDNEPEFVGLYTFGPGKGDKPTFACDMDKFPHYLMLEGCDNGQPLTNHRIPWNDDIQPDEDGEIYMFNGGKQWEICLGSADNVSYFRSAFNFVYLNSPHIHPFVGKLSELQKSQSVNNQHFYWVTQSGDGAAQYDLFRYDVLTGQWVDAGVNKLGDGQYAKLNMVTDLGVTPVSNVWETVNEQFKTARVQRFRNNAHLYFKRDDALYHLCFVLLIAATDNRAKNTYLYLDYYEGRIVIHFAQDDLDSIKKTDNEGRLNKPYYIETHDRNADNMPYWNGEENAMYDLFELAFPDEMRSMMRSILTAMASLASQQGAIMEANSDPLMQFMENYYYRIARSIPAVAYNETARIRYETAAIAWQQGKYVASVHPLAQSLGSQLENELEWMRQRLIYISSYASYGQFSMNGQGSLTFRSVKMLSGENPTYDFDLTPALWLYPAASSGSSTYFGTGNSRPVRVKAGEVFRLAGIPSDGNTNIQLHGIDYYTNIGEFGNKPLQGEAFGIAGERLTEFVASAMPAEFRPPKVTATAPMLRKIDLRNRVSVTGALDFSAQTRLESLDAWGTSITQFMVGDPTKITKLSLPATLTALSMENYTNLDTENFEIEGVAHIQTLTFHNCPNLNSQQLITSLLTEDGSQLSSCKIDNINWTNFSINNLMKLVDIDSDLEGYIEINSSHNLTFEMKQKILAKWGDVDKENNKLRLKYTQRPLQNVSVAGQKYFDKTGTYQLKVQPNSNNANKFSAIRWAMTNNGYATIDSKTGIVTVTKVGTEEQEPIAQITVTVTLTDGTEVSDTVTVGFYHRSCKLGDYVFADGSYSNVLDRSKTVVGICFYIDRKNPQNRLAVALSDVSTGIQWGLYFNNTTTDQNWIEGSANDLNYNIRDIELDDTLNYDVYDIPTIQNITSRGLTTLDGKDNAYITAETFRDEEYGDEDGFKIMSPTTAMGDMGFQELRSPIAGYKEGEIISKSLLKTLQIIEHRNIILNDSAVNLPVPYVGDKMTEMEHLNQLMLNIVNDLGAAKYRQFYYPAASLCHSYQPAVKTDEELSPLFLAGKWSLPCEGDLARLCWFHRCGYEVGDEGAIFAQGRVDGVFTAFTNTWYWSASESSRTYAWFVGFSDGGTSNYVKYNSGRVRAVVAF